MIYSTIDLLRRVHVLMLYYYDVSNVYASHDMGQGMRKRALGCSRIFLGLASKINYREKAENLEIVEAWDFPNASKSGDVGA